MEAQEQEEGKIARKFDAAVKTLVAVLGGKEKLLPARSIPKDDMSLIVDELFAEDKLRKKEQAKKDLKDILEKYGIFVKEVSEKEKELKKLKETKMEEFTKATQALLTRISGLSDIEKVYYEGLSIATKATEEPK